jgi:hypothetical protein
VQDNRYSPPSAELDSNTSGSQSAAQPPKTSGWFNARPIPVFIIAGWCILQFFGICLFMFEHWREVTELVRTGAESPLAFVGKFLYPALMFLAGLLLLFMRKAATFAFGLYLAWGATKVISQNIDFPGYLSLALVLGIVVYCLRLQQAGQLK